MAALGLLFYSAALLGLLALLTRLAVETITTPRKPLTFVSLAIAPPSVTVEVPRPVHVDLPAPKFEPPPTPEPPPPPPPEVKPPEPAPTPLIKPSAPPPPKPMVTVGAFDRQPTAATQAAPPKQVQATAFDTASVAASATRTQSVATGAFESVPGGKPTGAAPAAAVAPGGFDRPASNGTPGVAHGQVVSTGFDSKPAAQPARATGSVRAGGFGDAPAAPTTAPEGPKPPAPSTPVQVLYKPTPGYTDEARARRIQGTVVLDVEFTATGSVRVLHVVHGLGYGLDEIARQVATAMRFKPAMQDGQPVDSRATVEIVFRLT